MHFGRSAFGYSMLVLIAVGTVLTVFFLIKRRSRYQWPVHKTDAIKSDADTDAFYKSPVSSDLFTFFTNGQLWASILCLLFILAAVNLRMRRSSLEGDKTAR